MGAPRLPLGGELHPDGYEQDASIETTVFAGVVTAKQAESLPADCSTCWKFGEELE